MASPLSGKPRTSARFRRDWRRRSRPAPAARKEETRVGVVASHATRRGPQTYPRSSDGQIPTLSYTGPSLPLGRGRGGQVPARLVHGWWGDPRRLTALLSRLTLDCARPRACSPIRTAAAAAAVYGASAAKHLPAAGFEAPGSESDRAASKRAELRLDRPTARALPQPRARRPRQPFAARILDVIDTVVQDEGVIGVTSYYDTAQESLVSRDRHETLVIVSLAGSKVEKQRTFERLTPLLRRIEPPTEVAIGGVVAASVLAQQIAHVDIRSAEMMALPIAALLTLLFFRSVVAALLPILVGGFALASCTAIIRLGSNFVEIAVFALNIAAFLGLGLAIDYSLLLVQRFREELARNPSVPEAVAAALDKPGARVFFFLGLDSRTVSLSLLHRFAARFGFGPPRVRAIAHPRHRRRSSEPLLLLPRPRLLVHRSIGARGRSTKPGARMSPS